MVKWTHEKKKCGSHKICLNNLRFVRITELNINMLRVSCSANRLRSKCQSVFTARPCNTCVFCRHHTFYCIDNNSRTLSLIVSEYTVVGNTVITVIVILNPLNRLLLIFIMADKFDMNTSNPVTHHKRDNQTFAEITFVSWNKCC